jgi:hypothetical protein
MRTIPFIDVFNGVATRHGLDPLAVIPQQKARAIVRHINRRVRSGLRYWDLPEFNMTAERAFRQRWSSTRQFKVVGQNGKPDEVFYITDAQYYRVKKDAPSDPPPGTAPTNTTYWEIIIPVDTYLALDQICEQPMGMVLGVYGTNPRFGFNGYSYPLDYKASQYGIDVFNPIGPTVFVYYQMTVPVFTIIPWISGKLYSRGNIVFDPPSGDCFRCLAQTTNDPLTNLSVWSRLPFPESLASYCEAGAFADSLGEIPQGEKDAQPKIAAATAAGQEALENLYDEINVSIVNGQRHYYGYGMRYHGLWGIYTTQPWPGGWVTTLTEECDPGGYFPPAPISQSGITQLIMGQNYLEVTFITPMPDATWTFSQLIVVNTTDPTPFNLFPGTMTNKTANGFRLYFNGYPNSNNYYLHWEVKA